MQTQDTDNQEPQDPRARPGRSRGKVQTPETIRREISALRKEASRLSETLEPRPIPNQNKDNEAVTTPDQDLQPKYRKRGRLDPYLRNP